MNPPSAEIFLSIGLFLLSGLFVVLWWLYRQKDQDSKEKYLQLKEETDKAVALLFEKHDEDVSELNDLKLLIASKHYERTDLDAKFDRMEATFKSGFIELGAKFDKLTDVLTKHMIDTSLPSHNGRQ